MNRFYQIVKAANYIPSCSSAVVVQMKPNKKLSILNISIVLFSTLGYWVWESQAEGNIRIDLLLIYSILFAVYIWAFWKRYKLYSIIFSVGLMILNIIFFISSYELFGKKLG